MSSCHSQRILLPHFRCIFKCLNLNKHSAVRFIWRQRAGMVSSCKTVKAFSSSQGNIVLFVWLCFIISENVIRSWKVCIVTFRPPCLREGQQDSDLVQVCSNDAWCMVQSCQPAYQHELFCHHVDAGWPRPEWEGPFLFKSLEGWRQHLLCQS